MALLDNVKGILEAKPGPLEREEAEIELERVAIVDEKATVEKIAS